MAARTAELPGLLLAMAGVAAGFVVLLGAGFLIAGSPAPAPLPWLFLPACGVLVGVLGYAASRLGLRHMRLLQPGTGPRFTLFGRRALRRARKAGEAERAARRARLLSDPLRAHYVARMDAGEAWSDAQIEYDLQPSLTATCAHLQAVESAMRAAGVRLRRLHGMEVQAACVVDDAALRAHFALAGGVAYGEFEFHDRSLEDPPVARIRCPACGSQIEVIHPRVASPAVPRFPAPARAQVR